MRQDSLLCVDPASEHLEQAPAPEVSQALLGTDISCIVHDHRRRSVRHAGVAHRRLPDLFDHIDLVIVPGQQLLQPHVNSA